MLAEGIPMPWERESIGPTLYIAYLNIVIKRTELFAQYGEPVGSLTDVEKFCAWCCNQVGVFSNFYFTLSSPVGSWMSSWSIMYSAKDFILCPKEVLLVCEHKLKVLFINVPLQRSLICSIVSQKQNPSGACAARKASDMTVAPRNTQIHIEIHGKSEKYMPQWDKGTRLWERYTLIHSHNIHTQHCKVCERFPELKH